MSIGNKYIDRGLRVSDVANILHIPSCSFYRNDSNEGPSTRRGRKNSSFTLRKGGDETITVDNIFIVTETEKLLSRQFECYSYKKKTKQLNRLGCYSREIVGHYIGYHLSGRDVKETLMITFDKRSL
jgi:putative transposase